MKTEKSLLLSLLLSIQDARYILRARRRARRLRRPDPSAAELQRAAAASLRRAHQFRLRWTSRRLLVRGPGVASMSSIVTAPFSP